MFWISLLSSVLVLTKYTQVACWNYSNTHRLHAGKFFQIHTVCMLRNFQNCFIGQSLTSNFVPTSIINSRKINPKVRSNNCFSKHHCSPGASGDFENPRLLLEFLLTWSIGSWWAIVNLWCQSWFVIHQTTIRQLFALSNLLLNPWVEFHQKLGRNLGWSFQVAKRFQFHAEFWLPS